MIHTCLSAPCRLCQTARCWLEFYDCIEVAGESWLRRLISCERGGKSSHPSPPPQSGQNYESALSVAGKQRLLSTAGEQREHTHEPEREGPCYLSLFSVRGTSLYGLLLCPFTCAEAARCQFWPKLQEIYCHDQALPKIKKYWFHHYKLFLFFFSCDQVKKSFPLYLIL